MGLAQVGVFGSQEEEHSAVPLLSIDCNSIDYNGSCTRTGQCVLGVVQANSGLNFREERFRAPAPDFYAKRVIVKN
ncbi:hypothetical protein TNCV_2465561 [Trichonephila clavipes]|uniref:Uncharacterized protein n=1 Tax=Trichonephila clavipes TaxID=2585209 RepID=A0A8X6UXW5_TRICX|nr:hypothetical protein TNCV_2465561 [Trichonephila clavipes]